MRDFARTSRGSKTSAIRLVPARLRHRSGHRLLLFALVVGACFMAFDAAHRPHQARLHRDIVADPVLHGLVLNLYLNGEQYPHRVSDYFPFAAVEDAELERRMRAHMADEDKHIALYVQRHREARAAGDRIQPLDDIFNGVIRRHTPRDLRARGGRQPRHLPHQARALLRAPAFPREARGALARVPPRCLRALAAAPIRRRPSRAVLGDETRHVRYTREVVRQSCPRGSPREVLGVHARAERQRQPGFLRAGSSGAWCASRQRISRRRAAAFYRACAALLSGVLALA